MSIIKVKSYSKKLIGVVYKGKMFMCHPKSFMVVFKKPIQDFTNDELIKIINK